ncbi:MAG: hypothetical protein AAF664_21770 [Planctomycetota bacterium]
MSARSPRQDDTKAGHSAPAWKEWLSVHAVLGSLAVWILAAGFHEQVKSGEQPATVAPSVSRNRSAQAERTQSDVAWLRYVESTAGHYSNYDRDGNRQAIQAWKQVQQWASKQSMAAASRMGETEISPKEELQLAGVSFRSPGTQAWALGLPWSLVALCLIASLEFSIQRRRSRSFTARETAAQLIVEAGDIVRVKPIGYWTVRMIVCLLVVSALFVNSLSLLAGLGSSLL